MVSSDGHSMTRVIGGASFPATLGTVTVSWPLATAVADGTGVSVDVRLGFLRRLLGRFLDPDSRGQSSFWTASWNEISSVDLGRRSLAFHVNGRRGCRFVVLQRKRLEPLVNELESRGLSLHKGRTTLRWFISR
jgi:hypothetical protein